jgi:ABC-type sulfate transport system permease subunit
MKAVNLAIGIATTYLIIYTLLCATDTAIPLIMLMFSLSPLVVIGMVYAVIRHGKPSNHTFEERFYEDDY